MIRSCLSAAVVLGSLTRRVFGRAAVVPGRVRGASLGRAARAAILLGCAQVVLSAGCAQKGGASASSGPTVEDVVEGRHIYLTYGCVGCHGVSGGGGMGKPILDDTWIFGSDDDTLFKLVRGDVPKQTMPNVIGKALTDDQVRKVIVYVRSVYEGDKAKINWAVPPPVPAEMLRASVSTGDPIGAGKTLFSSACTQCHGPEGRGDGPGAIALNPKPRNLTDATYMVSLSDRYLYEVVSRGGMAMGKSPQMPPFGLNPQDINNIIAYVKTLSGGGDTVQTRPGGG